MKLPQILSAKNAIIALLLMALFATNIDYLDKFFHGGFLHAHGRQPKFVIRAVSADIVAAANSDRDQYHEPPRAITWNCKHRAETAREFDIVTPLRDRGSRDCVIWSDGRFDYLSTNILTDAALTSYVLIRRAGRSSPPQHVALFFVGGPREQIWFGVNSAVSEFWRALATRYDAVIVPGYYGTLNHDAAPRLNMQAARQEMGRFIAALRDQGAVHIHLLSASMGGLVTDQLLRDEAFPSLSINPPLQTLATLFSNTPEKRKFFRTHIESGSELFGNTILTWSTYEGYDFGFNQRFENHTWPYTVWARNYYYPYLDYLDIFVRDDKKVGYGGACNRIVVGDRDPGKQIGLDALRPQIARFPVTIIPGMDHYVDTPRERAAVMKEVDSFLAADC